MSVVIPLLVRALANQGSLSSPSRARARSRCPNPTADNETLLLFSSPNAQASQSGIRQMPCFLEYSIVGRSPGNLPLMKILVVDDHALIREALHGVLKKLTRDAVILEASNCAQTMEAVASHPDISLILLDLNLPDRDGFSMLAELRERNPAVSVVVLSATQDRANVMKALDLGAMGYIPKSAGMRSCSALFSWCLRGAYISLRRFWRASTCHRLHQGHLESAEQSCRPRIWA